MNEDNEELTKRHRQAMVRWQGYAREQRSAVTSIFLTYSAALLALMSSILLSDSLPKIAWSGLFIAAGVTAGLSLIVGCVVAVIRLKDARSTARIARFKVKKKPKSEIDILRASTENMGRWINCLIPVQIGTFALGASVFLAWILFSFGSKLEVSDREQGGADQPAAAVDSKSE